MLLPVQQSPDIDVLLPSHKAALLLNGESAKLRLTADVQMCKCAAHSLWQQIRSCVVKE
jgi:hypothetical protein